MYTTLVFSKIANFSRTKKPPSANRGKEVKYPICSLTGAKEV